MMATVGNNHVGGDLDGSVGNAMVNDELYDETATDPTLGNGDGTYDISFPDVRNIETTDDVVGVSWDGGHKVSVDSVSGNTVSVLFESPSGTDSFTNESDGQVTGTLEVRVKA
jgi:hypothetical protein